MSYYAAKGYIKKVETENNELKKALNVIAKNILDLERYLLSNKFQGQENNFVNPTDVLTRLSESLDLVRGN